MIMLQILLKPKFSGVQKIKTIGSTYMAATGLNKKVQKKTGDSDLHSRMSYDVCIVTDHTKN